MTSLAGIAQTVPTDVIQPNEHLTAEGIPEISSALALRAARYNDFRARGLVEWHPVRREMLVATRTKGVGTQLHLLRKPMGELEQLTDYPDPVRSGTFEPKNGTYIVFEKDEGGSEATQLFRLDLDTRKVTLLTDPAEKHSTGAWNHAGNRLLFSSTQLDKTAGAGGRAEITTDVYSIDPLDPNSKRKIASLPGGGWFDFQWSPDDRQLAAMNYKSANQSSVWLIEAGDGKRRQILPAPGASADSLVSYQNIRFSKDGTQLFITTDSSGEFQQLTRVNLSSLDSTPMSGHIPWDITAIEPAKTTNRIVTVVNNDGLAALHLFDAKSGTEIARPAVPVGGITQLKWRDGQELGFGLNSASSPGEIHSLDTVTGVVEQWTNPHAEMDTRAFRDATIVRWKSFDGQTISGLVSKPAEALLDQKFKGRRPVVILIHGGPEAQATIGFMHRYNYLINELGIVVIQPNVRGSRGYGKTFLQLDNGYRREDSVKDIGALLDWIGTQPDLDAERVVVMGGSYGGYMSLAVATNYADRIRGAVDVVGISNFVSFLERTESYRRDLRRVEYGDERDPAMRAFMERIAPLNNAQKITKPLFVVQGKNDPRVPLFEAEQIVARVRQNKVPVWYLMADNEGHGFARKPNADFYFLSLVRFMEENLLK
ncbi:MAG: S9 family peptidase [Herminiimonas sp.]|nr:S9 family peptidase [Herminiimonas sp.]